MNNLKKMKKTQVKILTNATSLFNKKGVGNVRLQDIAKKSGISAGNLSYHYKTKKDLMEAVLAFMSANFSDSKNTNLVLLENNDYKGLIKNYLGFQISHRFFYRDILEIINLVPSAKIVFENQIKQVINFSKNGIDLAVGNGIMISEPYEGHYELFAKNNWAIMQGWLIERDVLGEKKVNINQVILAVLESHYPYFTKKGKELFEGLKKQLPRLIEQKKVF